MNATIVSFHFLAPHRPCEQLLRAHQERLDRLAGITSSITLDSRWEIALLLTYENQRAIDAYFASEEFQRMSRQPGCSDVFVKAFTLLPESAIDTPVDEMQIEDSLSASSVPGV